MQTLASPTLPESALHTESLGRHANAHLERRYDAKAFSYEEQALHSHRLHLLVGDREKAGGFLHQVSSFLEKLTRPRIHVGSKDYSSYHVFGLLGIIAAAIIATSLTYLRGLSLEILLGLLVLAAAVSWLNVYLTKKITGKDRLVFLRYFIPILAVSLLFLRLLNQPIILYLEPLMLGIGTMQGIGRIGCFMVGCCHDKPARLGFRYSDTHSMYGFPRRLLGIRFFPIQLVESTWIFISAGTGISLVVLGAAPGLGLATYIVMFSAGRFLLELIRGDRWRRQFGYFSEAQWVSFSMMMIICMLEWAGVLPFVTWHLWVVLGIALTGGYVLLRRLQEPGLPIDAPHHRSEIIRTLVILEKGLQLPAHSHSAVHIRTTSAALQLSMGRHSLTEPNIYHYTMSFSDRNMQLRDARDIANIIANWHPHPGRTTLLEDRFNIFHMVRYRESDL